MPDAIINPAVTHECINTLRASGDLQEVAAAWAWLELTYGCDLAMEYLRAYDAEQADTAALMPETIVHYKGQAVNSIKTAWKTCKKNAGIARRLRPYNLRHAFATYAMDEGGDLKDVADIMEHADVSTALKHYRHGKEASSRATVETIPSLPPLCAQKKKDSRTDT